MMAATTTIAVPHLGGIKAGYKLSGNKYDPSKPTVVLINSMCTTVELYEAQFSDTKLTDAMNLLAIEPLGHGSTSCPTEHFTYWDTAIMAWQVLDALGIKKAFALGTSQGGWIVIRMALIAPERILGVIPLGTSIDSESPDSRTKGCWDPAPIVMPFIEKWTSPVPTPEFVVDDVWAGLIGSLGFGTSVTEETVAWWKGAVKGIYKGDEGRRKIRMAAICLLERDGLKIRARDIRCPVWWLQGTEDVVYGKTIQEEQIALFTSSVDAKVQIVEGGAHYLNATSPKEVGSALLEMVNKYK